MRVNARAHRLCTTGAALSECHRESQSEPRIPRPASFPICRAGRGPTGTVRGSVFTSAGAGWGVILFRFNRLLIIRTSSKGSYSVKVYESKDIRNVGVVGHGDSGKTTLTAALLFTAGATNRLLRVDEGNTITDFDEEEIQRKITISTAIAVAEWNKTKINILDTPGYNIFINDTRGALVAADAALVVVDGVAGVEVQTEKVWSFANEFKLPRAVIINKLDRERADFQRALASVQEFFGRAAVPIHLPIGSEREFKGIIDLIRMKAFIYTPGGDGKGKEGEIPSQYAEEAQKAHEALVEIVAEGNDAYMEEFFEKGTLPIDHILE